MFLLGLPESSLKMGDVRREVDGKLPGQRQLASLVCVLSYTLQHFSFQICLRVNVSFSLFPS